MALLGGEIELQQYVLAVWLMVPGFVQVKTYFPRSKAMARLASLGLSAKDSMDYPALSSRFPSSGLASSEVSGKPCKLHLMVTSSWLPLTSVRLILALSRALMLQVNGFNKFTGDQSVIKPSRQTPAPG